MCLSIHTCVDVKIHTWIYVFVIYMCDVYIYMCKYNMYTLKGVIEK